VRDNQQHVKKKELAKSEAPDYHMDITKH